VTLVSIFDLCHLEALRAGFLVLAHLGSHYWRVNTGAGARSSIGASTSVVAQGGFNFASGDLTAITPGMVASSSMPNQPIYLLHTC